jgi:hypothetical protein
VPFIAFLSVEELGASRPGGVAGALESYRARHRSPFRLRNGQW